MDSISNDFSHLSVGDLHTSSDPTTPSELNRISLEHDTFTDDDHNLLDEKIVNAFNIFRRYHEEPPLPLLLSNITVDDKRLVTLSTTDEVRELLKSGALHRNVAKEQVASGECDNYVCSPSVVRLIFD